MLAFVTRENSFVAIENYNNLFVAVQNYTFPSLPSVLDFPFPRYRCVTEESRRDFTPIPDVQTPSDFAPPTASQRRPPRPPSPAQSCSSASTTPPSSRTRTTPPHRARLLRPRTRLQAPASARRPHARGAAVDGSLLTPGASGITAPSKMAAVLRALPLLAIPFLPPPVALSSLASRVSARFDDCFKLNHATCTGKALKS